MEKLNGLPRKTAQWDMQNPELSVDNGVGIGLGFFLASSIALQGTFLHWQLFSGSSINIPSQWSQKQMLKWRLQLLQGMLQHIEAT